MEIDIEARAVRNVVTMGTRGIVAECATPIDAVRIAACINACRGVSTYALSAGVKPMAHLARVRDAIAILQEIAP